MIVEERKNILYFIKASEGCWLTLKGATSLPKQQFAKEICITSPDMVDDFEEITDEEYQAIQENEDSLKTEAELLDKEVDPEEVLDYIESILN